MSKTAITLCLLLIPLGAALAGWERTYGGSDFDYGTAVVQTSDGGYIVAGWTESFSIGESDVYLIKTDSFGDTVWSRIYGGSGADAVYSLVQTFDGGYIATGRTSSFGAGSYDVYVLKFTSSGDTLWTRTYGGSEWDSGYSIAQTSDSGYVITGWTRSFGVVHFDDVYILKLDSSGDTIWTRIYGGSGWDWGFSVAQTSDNGYIIAGVTYSFGADSGDVYLIRTDTNGDTIWTRTYGGSNQDFGRSVAQMSDGGFFVAGWTKSYGSGFADAYLIKTDSSGDTVWTRTYGGSGSDAIYSLSPSVDGEYIMAGSQGLYPNDGVSLLKINIFGDTLWTRTYNRSEYEEGYSVIQTADSGYIIVGFTGSWGAGDRDVYLIKTDSLGYTAIGESPSARPEDIAISAYPNPFNSAVNIRFSVLGSRFSDIEIFDINGRMVAEIPATGSESAKLSSTTASGVCRWQPDKSITSGVYLIRIKGTNAATKIIYMK